ncbi:hypothetical protein PEC18_12190 [Paucibacter sp. O1-1]|nr:hypothetical protein [Paucibacter sp. O1-1]MDA3826576.1 hypothetical protein [Paucibacter sp. O1-1]
MNAALMTLPEPLLPAPASWAAVDSPRRPRLLNITVTLPTARVSYQRRFASSMDAYSDALDRYRDCVSITVEPAEVSK